MIVNGKPIFKRLTSHILRPEEIYTFQNLRQVHSTMKAIVIDEFGGPEVLKMKEIPVPQISENQVLIKVMAAGINPADTYMRSGNYAILPPLPAVLGSEVAGIVEQTHSSCQTFQKGDRVYGYLPNRGGYAEYVACDESRCFVLPQRLSFAQGSRLPITSATAFKALIIRGKIKPGETVLVHGASGGVGCAAVQIAKANGAFVIGTAGSDEGKRIVLDSGADYVADHSEENYLNKALKDTDRKGFDVILENLANINLQKDIDHLAKNGRIIVVGNRGAIEINPRGLMMVDGSIHAFLIFNSSKAELQLINEQMLKGANDGWLTPIIGSEHIFEEASIAHENIISQKSKGSFVFKVQ